MHCKTVNILLRIRIRGHFVTSITKNYESHYATVLDNPRYHQRLCSEPLHLNSAHASFNLMVPASCRTLICSSLMIIKAR